MEPGTDLNLRILDKMLTEGHKKISPIRFAEFIADGLALEQSGAFNNVHLTSNISSPTFTMSRMIRPYLMVMPLFFVSLALYVFLTKVNLEYDSAENSEAKRISALFFIGSLYKIVQLQSLAYKSDKSDLQLLEIEFRRAMMNFKREINLARESEFLPAYEAAEKQLITPAFNALRNQERGYLFKTIERDVDVSQVRAEYLKKR